MRTDPEMPLAFPGDNQFARHASGGGGPNLPSGVLFEKPEGRTKWLRRAAAACYFHSGMSLALRHLRERYELSFTDGTRGKFPLHRRRRGSARILYYHRVNDDNDPFFKALPTAVFEQQMKYLARHYRVVSLTEIIRYLEGDGPPDTLVGITFDDGYEDNYRNAFPILSRYNLPATIFLATGSIDSGEPLWFERLAEAVKNSPCEFIDIEVNEPLRFWMRSQAERLESSSRIFSLLRNLSDTERNLWLSEILRRLGAVGKSERCNKMLSWEHVRLMKGHGIDFGGHTVSHPFLSRLTASQMAWEVSECKRRIEDELQQPVDHFAYPNGREGDFNPATKDALRTAGYRAAMTTIWGLNSPSSDPMELRRGGPWENNPALFACKLDWYQLVNG
jgi:peptidoglycan/xylan/chitin deacetylase (PgdA/CDA1 family)